MNANRINGREQGHEACEESTRTRRRTKDPEFDRALASASCGPQDSSPASAGAEKAAPCAGSGQPNACVQAEMTPKANGQSTGAIQIPELMAHSAREEASRTDRSASRTRLDSASTTAPGTGDHPAHQSEIARTDRESQELPAQVRRLWMDVRLQSPGGESSTLDTDTSGAKAEPISSQSWITTAWNQGVTGRPVDTRVAAGMPQHGADSTPEQTNSPPGAGDRPSNHVTIHFAGERGLDGRLRVAVRGQSVQATIVSEDHAMADRLGRNIDELHHALRARGFSEANVSIHRAQQQQQTPPDRLPQETGPHREDQGREETEMQRDRNRSDSEDRRARHGQEHHGSER